MDFTLTINGEVVDPRTIYDLTVTAGRDDIESQPDATVLNFTMLNYGSEQVGFPVTLTDEYGHIFSGFISDLKAEQDEEMEWQVQCVATGPMALLGQLSAGEGGWPEESDSARIYRILEEVGFLHNVNPGSSGPTILSNPAGEVVNAAEAARKVADSGMGVFWEKPSDPQMKLQYFPARQRTWKSYELTWAELPPGPWTSLTSQWSDLNSDSEGSGTSTYPGYVVLDPSASNAEVTFEQSIGDIARTIVVEYGVAPEGGGSRPTSVAGNRIPEATFDTQLALTTDAATFATTMLRRKQQPAWRLTEILLHVDLMSDLQIQKLRKDLSVGMRITIPFPKGSPVGNSWDGYLEGWEHRATAESYTITLNVSDRQLTEPADRWSDMTSTAMWTDIPSDLQWVYAVDLP